MITKSKSRSSISDRYSFRVSKYHTHSTVEKLLLLGLSHKTIESACKRTTWAYLENPAGPAMVCIMNHKETQKDVGLVTLCMRQLWTPNGTATVGIFCDLVTDLSHRTMGPALKMMEHALSGADKAMLDRTYGWPSDSSAALFRRLPAAQVGKINIYRRYFDWTEKLKTRLPTRAASIAGKAIKSLDVCLYRTNTAFMSLFLYTRSPQFFTEEFDELWDIAKIRYEEIGVRDSEFLNWRFNDIPDHDHKVFALYSRQKNRLKGYIVYREIDEDIIEISDFLSDHGNFSERCLLNSFCAHFRAQGYKKISLLFAGKSKTVQNLWRCGFIKVGSRVCNFRQGDASPLSDNSNQTHVTQADQDVG